jgi:hypothetical protein
MIIIADPPGSGKSSLYPVSAFGVAYFNADDRAAELNGGSFQHISKEIRRTVNREFEGFVRVSIEKRCQFRDRDNSAQHLKPTIWVEAGWFVTYFDDQRYVLGKAEIGIRPAVRKVIGLCRELGRVNPSAGV